MSNYTKQQLIIIKQKALASGKTLEDLRKDDKKSKKKLKEKPSINKKNKINLETKETLRDKIRESNRTAILLSREYDV
jgi:hypothetical protein